MQCRTVRNQLPFYSHNDLSPALQNEISKHLTHCALCQEALGREEKTDQLIARQMNVDVVFQARTPPSTSAYTAIHRVNRSVATIAVLVLLLLTTVGGATATVYYVVNERSQWHNSLSSVGEDVSFTLFSTSAARVERVQVLEDAVQPLVYVTYILPDGRRFGLSQSPVYHPAIELGNVPVLNSKVSVGDGGVLFLATYVSSDELNLPDRQLPSIVWRDKGTELRIVLDPEYPMSAEEVIALAKTFVAVAPASK